MAKDNQDIDRLFRDRLADHSVQPSPLAWDKLEGRLSQSKKAGVPWMRIAASFLLMGGVAVLMWLSVPTAPEEPDIVADQQPVQEITPKEAPVMHETPAVEENKEKAPTLAKKPNLIKPQQAVTKPTLAAAEPVEDEPSNTVNIPIQEVAPIELPPLDTDLLVAENSLAEPEEAVYREIEYKITIISNGISTTPQKGTLVGEIENKIDQIGGLIGKVDQGFADLQDAKNNLFASIATKK
jgi:hypothetical protein